MQFGHIDKFILFGGGEILFLFARELLRRNLETLVITSKRHAEEIITDGDNLKTTLEKAGISLRVVKSLDSGEVTKEITGSAVGFSFGAAWIFKKDFIARFGGKLLNMHCTRLPQNRGGGGYSWIIMKGESVGARLLHLVDCGIDTGHIVRMEEYVYPPSCRKPVDYHEYNKSHQVRFLTTFIDDAMSGAEFELSVQQECFSSYFPRLNTDIHGFINWQWSTMELERFICAFDDPYKGASTFFEGIRVRVKDCVSMNSDGSFHPFQYGLVYRKAGRTLFVAANGGSLVIRDVRDEDGNDISDRIPAGGRLFTPAEYLENAMLYKAVYLPEGLKPE